MATAVQPQPISMMGQMKSLQWPAIWSSEDLKGVFRRIGKQLSPLDPTLYADLYTEAGIDPDTEEPGEPEAPGGGDTEPPAGGEEEPTVP